MVYRARAGNLTALPTGRSLATPGADFATQPLEAELDDGQQSAVITVNVLEVANKISSYLFSVHLS